MTDPETTFQAAYQIGVDAIDSMDKLKLHPAHAFPGLLAALLTCLYHVSPKDEVADDILTFARECAKNNNYGENAYATFNAED